MIDPVKRLPLEHHRKLVGALLLEQDDEWANERSRHMTLETIATMSDDPLISMPAAS